MVSAAAPRVPASAPVQAPTAPPLVERFDPEVLKLGFTAVPNLLLDCYSQLGLSHSEMLFTLHLLQKQWGTANPHPSLQTIAAKMGVSWRQAQSYAKRLEYKKLLVISHRFAPELGQLSNDYDLAPLITALLELTGSQPADSSEHQHAEAPAISRHTPLHIPTGAPLQDPSDNEDYFAKNSKRDPVQKFRVSNTPPSNQVSEFDQGSEAALTATSRTLSSQFDDSHHEKSNSTRLAKLHLWSELSVPAFLKHVEQARSITATRLRDGRTRKPMAYFFKVLTSLLGIHEEPLVADRREPLPPAVLAEERAGGQPTPLDEENIAGSADDEQAKEDTETTDGLAAVWQQVQERLRGQMTSANYHTWLQDTVLLELEEDHAVVAPATEFAVEWLQKRLVTQIEEALAKVLGRQVSCRIILVGEAAR